MYSNLLLIEVFIMLLFLHINLTLFQSNNITHLYNYEDEPLKDNINLHFLIYPSTYYNYVLVYIYLCSLFVFPKQGQKKGSLL